jgi:hypothetical protein
MDSEIILVELMTNDDIETCCLSPSFSMIIYISIIYSVFSNYTDDNITNLFILVIMWFTFNCYKRDFDILMKNLCY